MKKRKKKQKIRRSTDNNRKSYWNILEWILLDACTLQNWKKNTGQKEEMWHPRFIFFCFIIFSNEWSFLFQINLYLDVITLKLLFFLLSKFKHLQVFDDIIFAFFTLEMSIKMVAMGIYGHGTYLADSWNRLDFFIVMAG